ncbi:hypothetical protein M2138_001130 [Dysgonomonadaceae bacterium PH5-43]|nr:hypothetical protein [Dysgonomonadaceae bacterium PH5-43]
MKKTSFRTIRRLLLLVIIVGLFTACGTTRCECENSNDYNKRKLSDNLLDFNKSSNFALQNTEVLSKELNLFIL